MAAPKLLVRECPKCRRLHMTNDPTGAAICDVCLKEEAEKIGEPTIAPDPPADAPSPTETEPFKWDVKPASDGKGSSVALIDPHDTET